MSVERAQIEAALNGALQPRALEVLELESDATFEEVRTAWRRLAKSNHPDVRPGDAEAAKRFQGIQAAYEVLRAAEERRSWKPA